jgi:hypothetical protein
VGYENLTMGHICHRIWIVKDIYNATPYNSFHSKLIDVTLFKMIEPPNQRLEDTSVPKPDITKDA